MWCIQEGKIPENKRGETAAANVKTVYLSQQAEERQKLFTC